MWIDFTCRLASFRSKAIGLQAALLQIKITVFTVFHFASSIFNITCSGFGDRRRLEFILSPLGAVFTHLSSSTPLSMVWLCRRCGLLQDIKTAQSPALCQNQAMDSSKCLLGVPCNRRGPHRWALVGALRNVDHDVGDFTTLVWIFDNCLLRRNERKEWNCEWVRPRLFND